MKYSTLLATACITTACLAFFNIAEAAPPSFSVTTADGVRAYTSTDMKKVSGTSWSVSDSLVTATLKDVGSSRWELTIKPKVVVTQTVFPSESPTTGLSTTDGIAYIPYIMGFTRKLSAGGSFALQYPGGLALPLYVIADKNDAVIVAATNWPAKTVTPTWSGMQITMQYDEVIPVGGSQKYGAIVATVSGNADTGAVPWQLALDYYKKWFDDKMGTVTYPSWMWQGQGIFNIGLQNVDNPFSTTTLDTYWQPVKSLYPWVLYWGQMSPYAAGCCETSYTMHERYVPSLPDYVRTSIVAKGLHGGYYSAPNWSDQAAYSLDTQLGRDWLQGWIAANKANGANSYYIDTLARAYWGSPQTIRGMMSDGSIPKDTMLEGVVDIYPRPGLISGSLAGDANSCGAPNKRPEDYDKTTLPGFVRYVLSDKLIYEGMSNIDWKFWGAYRGWDADDEFNRLYCGSEWKAHCATVSCDYGTERLAFLLGAKLDVQLSGAQGNPILDQINAERIRVNWWSRKPKYLDTKGLNLTTISKSLEVEVRRFVDTNGKTLLAISNPLQKSDLAFTVDGRSVSVPTQQIAVVELSSRRSDSSTSNYALCEWLSAPGTPSSSLAASYATSIFDFIRSSVCR